jgi:cysteine synthase A
MALRHAIQGTTPDFISKLAQDAIDEGLISTVVGVNGGEALRLARELAIREGVLAGISSGATLAAGQKILQSAPPGTTVLCMLADTGERYLSTPLFESVGADMSEEERAISASTPSAQFDAAPAPAPASAVPLTADAESQAELESLIAEHPVVLFALEWCEFCWSLRKLLKALGVPHHDVALDAAALKSGDRGLRLRRALTAKTGMATIPQLFIGGRFMGGCLDAFSAAASGELARQLETVGLRMQAPKDFAPEEFLPRWLLTKPTFSQAAE